MILDTSAVVAAIREEEGSKDLLQKMEGALQVGIGSPTLVEAMVVLVRRHGSSGRIALSRFIEDRDVRVLPFGAQHLDAAADAFVRFGKGRHQAALNLGDCMTYATAKVANEPLLFVGNDFARTDIAPA
jgi:ribonuclease VapC